MTDDEAIAAVERGERVKMPCSLKDTESPDSWKCRHRWREIACNSDRDVIECMDCGKQETCACTFDDEYA